MKRVYSSPALVALAINLVLAGVSIAGEDDEKKKGKNSESISAPKLEKREDAEKQLPSFELADDASLDDTQAFIEELQKFRPTSRETYDQMRAGLQSGNERMVALLTEKGDTKSELFMNAKRSLISGSMMDLSDPEKAEGTLKGIVDFLSSVETLTAEDSRMAVMAGFYLSNSEGVGEDAANAFFGEASKMLRNGGEELAKDADMLEGLARRQNLIGQSLKLSGTKLNGDKFDIGDLKGKVTLVDFWATWCGPCVAEHPNIEKQYELYHEKGFEVVGISLDRDRDQLEKFVEDHDTKWIVLHDEGGTNEATTYYGVVGIPSMFLLDQEGKVVSTTARGPALRKELENLLGKVEEPEDSKSIQLEEPVAEAVGADK
ncbi:MAG: TlpA family protein disulfide reductase [Aureliella sp.]